MGAMPISCPQPHMACVVLAGQHQTEQCLAFLAQSMPRLRYHFESRGPNWLRANLMRPFGQDALHRPHALVVESDGSGVRITFEYHPSTKLPPGELMQIERFATAIMSDFSSWAIQQSFQQPPPPSYGCPPPGHGAYGPPSHVVERQVVVIRCKFCQAHTPLDGPRCASCGAERFS